MKAILLLTETLPIREDPKPMEDVAPFELDFWPPLPSGLNVGDERYHIIGHRFAIVDGALRAELVVVSQDVFRVAQARAQLAESGLDLGVGPPRG